MPLKSGKNRKVISSNVREMVHSYERTGRIGRIKPKNKKQAVKIAVAAALKKARKSKK